MGRWLRGTSLYQSFSGRLRPFHPSDMPLALPRHWSLMRRSRSVRLGRLLCPITGWLKACPPNVGAFQAPPHCPCGEISRTIFWAGSAVQRRSENHSDDTVKLLAHPPGVAQLAWSWVVRPRRCPHFHSTAGISPLRATIASPVGHQHSGARSYHPRSSWAQSAEAGPAITERSDARCIHAGPVDRLDSFLDRRAGRW